MAKHLALAVVVLCAWVNVATAHRCPLDVNPPCDDDGVRRTWLFVGVIGKAKVRAFLEQECTAINGIYYYERFFEPIALQGTINPDGRFELAEGDPGTNSISGKLTAGGGFRGEWQSHDGGRAVKVTLSKDHPPDCSGAGPWSEFQRPDWPFTFRYPAAFRIKVGDRALTLQCPSPGPMVFEDSGIVIGTGTGKAALEQHQLYYRKKRWMLCGLVMGGCDPNPGIDQLHPAKVKKRAGMDVIETSPEYRTYCRGGGYGGAAQSSETFMINGDAWLHLHTWLYDDVARRIGLTVRSVTP